MFPNWATIYHCHLHQKQVLMGAETAPMTYAEKSWMSAFDGREAPEHEAAGLNPHPPKEMRLYARLLGHLEAAEVGEHLEWGSVPMTRGPASYILTVRQCYVTVEVVETHVSPIRCNCHTWALHSHTSAFVSCIFHRLSFCVPLWCVVPQRHRCLEM